MNASTSAILAHKLIEFSNSLSDAERYNFHLIMSVGIGGMVHKASSSPLDEKKKITWDAGLEVLAKMNPFGFFSLGRVGFIFDEYLEVLTIEANLREPHAKRFGPHALLEGGVSSELLSKDCRFQDLISNTVGFKVQPTNTINYHFYNREGDYLPPHVDPEESSFVNCVIGIERIPPDDGSDGSALLVYNVNGSTERFIINPSEVVIILASGTVHAREALKHGEKLITLTIGFRPASNVGSSSNSSIFTSTLNNYPFNQTGE